MRRLATLRCADSSASSSITASFVNLRGKLGTLLNLHAADRALTGAYSGNTPAAMSLSNSHKRFRDKLYPARIAPAMSLPETLHPISGISCFAVKELNYLPD